MARILVIDDDVMLIKLLEEHLTQEGFDVASACYAGEGLQMALHNPPDLIMLDLMLPDATGYQTCAKLRQSPQTHSVPIIMMTSAARLPSQHAIGRMMGANDCMVKPLNLIETGDRVHQLLGSAPRVRKTPIPQQAPAASPAKSALLNCQGAMRPAGPSNLRFVSSSEALFDDSAK